MKQRENTELVRSWGKGPGKGGKDRDAGKKVSQKREQSRRRDIATRPSGGKNFALFLGGEGTRMKVGNK